MASQGPALISGRVLDGDGNPVAGARVYFVAGPGSFPDVAALTSEEGAFTLSAPTAGPYEVQGAADGFAPRSVTVTAEAGEEATCEIVLEQA